VLDPLDEDCMKSSLNVRISIRLQLDAPAEAAY